jgi:hypothetical protein
MVMAPRQTMSHEQRRQKAEGIQHIENVVEDGTDISSVRKPTADEFGAHAKTDPREIRLVKKIDLYVLVGGPIRWSSSSCSLLHQPILWLMYFLNYLDRNAMINGKLDTLAEDLHLEDVQYNTCVSILFVGYLVGQVPSNMILNRVRPSWYMAGKISP